MSHITKEMKDGYISISLYGVEIMKVRGEDDLPRAEKFLEDEKRIFQQREELLRRVVALRDQLMESDKEVVWRLQALQFAQDEPRRGGWQTREEIERFKTSHKIGLIELNEKEILVFQWTDQDVARLEQIIGVWIEKNDERRQGLWESFVANKGIFTKTQKEKSAWAGKSFGRAMATARSSHPSEGKWDEWTETTYFVGGEPVSDSEYQWLRARYSEIEIPEGYYRSSDDLGSLKEVIYPSEEKSWVVLWGKTGNSRRGVVPKGTIWEGRPENLPESVTGRVWEVRLNGEVIAKGKGCFSLVWKTLKSWNTPGARALRALRPEAGFREIKDLLPYVSEDGRRPYDKIRGLVGEAIALASTY